MKHKFLTLTLCVTASFSLTACLSGGVSNNGWGVNANTGNILGADFLNVLGSIGGSASALSQGDISAGLREALTIGTGVVANQLGQTNGFNLDPNIRIPLPSSLARVDDVLQKVGMNSLTANLENRLNSAAELATPMAKDLFISAISQMTITDAKNILTGPNNAATEYLRRTMGTQLGTQMQPVIAQTLASAGAVQAYDQVTNQYNAVPFMSALGIPDAKTALNDYVTEKALDGIFYYVAQEEAAIRTNPAKRTTELLQKVFANR